MEAGEEDQTESPAMRRMMERVLAEVAAEEEANPTPPEITALYESGRTAVAAAPPEAIKAITDRDRRIRALKELPFDLPRREIGFAAQFEVIGVGRFLYSEAERLWLDYAAGVWRPGEAAAREQVKLIIDAAIAYAREVQRRAIEAGIQEEIRAARALFALATGLQREHVITATLNVARTSPVFRVEGPAAFDREPHLFCTANGVVDLRTGDLLPHSQQHRMRSRSPVVYDAGAECPLWLRFLHEVSHGDTQYVDWLQCAIGYTLTGEVADEVLFFMFGHGRNGKSVFANVLQTVLGDYEARLPSEALMVARDGSNRDAASPTLAGMPGKRMVLANEVESGAKLSSAQVKVLVSTEQIVARKLYSEPFKFAPTHKVWVRGNHKPIVQDTDDGIWRRLLLLPFTRQFSGAEVDPLLAAKLQAEAPGILAWAVVGARRWYEKHQLPSPPRVVVEASAEYRADSDFVAQWIGESCVRRFDATVAASAAYEAYQRWSHDNGVRPLSRPVLTRRLAALGIQTERRRTGGALERVYVGIDLAF